MADWLNKRLCSRVSQPKGPKDLTRLEVFVVML